MTPNPEEPDMSLAAVPTSAEPAMQPVPLLPMDLIASVSRALNRHHLDHLQPAVLTILEPYLAHRRAMNTPPRAALVPIGVVIALHQLMPSVPVGLAPAVLDEVAPWLIAPILPSVRTRPPLSAHRAAYTHSITTAEHRVLQGIARGLTNYEIGRDTAQSEHTVKSMVQRVFKKLGADSRSHAVHRGWQLGLLSGSDS